MGYCVNQGETKFKIKGRNVAKAWDAVANLDDGKTRYSWVNPGFGDEDTFYDCVLEWGWELSLDAKGNVTDIEFQTEKLGDEKKLFEAMAPFVESGSYITMAGEDGESWRWVFKNGKLDEKGAFEDEESEGYTIVSHIRSTNSAGVSTYGYTVKHEGKVLCRDVDLAIAYFTIIQNAGIEVLEL